MANETKLAVILHADVVGSTELVQRDERLAHERVRSAFLHLSKLSGDHGGEAHEIRGDALVAEFPRPSDAVSAAMDFQREHRTNLDSMRDGILPRIRVGIAMGEVVVADSTITGAGVVLAQRLEQLASPGGVCISAAVRESLPGRLSFRYEDMGEQELKGFNLAQRAFAVHVTGAEAVHDNVPEPSSSKQRGEGAFTGASLVILPFENKSNDPDGEYLADGLTEDITTAMSSLHWLLVIARPSAAATAERTQDIQQIGSELGVEYAVTGTVRMSGSRIRVTADLNDARHGRQVWSKRYDRVVEDIFDVQDDLARSVAAELAPEITKSGLEVIGRTPPQNLNAWEAYQRGLAALLVRSNEALIEARRYLEAATEHDPRFASSYAALGLVRWYQIIWRTIKPEEVAVATDEMFSLAAQALALDRRESVALVVRGMAYFLRNQYELALSEMDGALNANPSSALALVMRGTVQTSSHGDNERAIEDLKLAERISPSDPLSRQQRLSAFAFANWQLERYEEAARYGEEAFRGGAFYGPLFGIAATVCLGDLDEARRRVGELVAQRPNISMRFLRETIFSLMPQDDVTERCQRQLEHAGLPPG